MRVLVVDDEEDIRTVMQGVLAWRLAAEVEVAASGPEALELVRGGRRFDVVLADERMPSMTGSTLLRRLREEGHDGGRLLMSAYGAGFAEAAAGCDGFLPKPVALEDLVQAVAAAAVRT